MKTRIRCTETTVDGVVTKTYRAEVFCWWYNMAVWDWRPAREKLCYLAREVCWADEEEVRAYLGGCETQTEERAKAVIDRLWLKVEQERKSRAAYKSKKRQEKSSKKTTFIPYP